MADPADNAGGGAPSDNTSILRRMIERSVEDAAAGPDLGSDRRTHLHRRGRRSDYPSALRR